MQEAITRSGRRMFSASDDSAMLKQVQATHAPDGREVDVRPILSIIEDIFRRATPSGIDEVVNVIILISFSHDFNYANQFTSFVYDNMHINWWQFS